LTRVAQEFCDFFASTSQRAEAEFPSPVATTPLVDLGSVLSSQASRPLDPACEVRLRAPDRVGLLTAGLLDEAAVRVACVLTAFAGRERVTLDHLAQALASAGRAENDRHLTGTTGDRAPSAFEDNARLLVRMLNFGILEPA
jgi:hypothetical protein